MYTRVDRAHRALPVVLGLITLASVGVLFAFDVAPEYFSARAHDWLGAFPLAMIAVAYLVYQSVHRPSGKEWLKAILLVAAFLFWAANQCWRDPHEAMVFNDVAIALFVLDVFLVMIGWPAASPDESFGETYAEREGGR
jgi:hypothetical protein